MKALSKNSRFFVGGKVSYSICVCISLRIHPIMPLLSTNSKSKTLFLHERSNPGKEEAEKKATKQNKTKDLNFFWVSSKRNSFSNRQWFLICDSSKSFPDKKVSKPRRQSFGYLDIPSSISSRSLSKTWGSIFSSDAKGLKQKELRIEKRWRPHPEYE